MPTTILTGTVFPDPAKQQPYEYGRRESGRYASVPYESVSSSTIDALAASADAAGLNYKVSTTFGKARIVIEYPYNWANTSFPNTSTESEQVWEIMPNIATKDLLDSCNPLVLACTAAELTELKKRQLGNTLQSSEYFDTGTGLMSGTQTYGTGTGSGTFGNAAMALYYALLQDVNTVDIPVPVLTHTSTVTLNYINLATFINVGLIYSSATLIATESIPSAILFDFPTNSDPSPLVFSTNATLTQVLLYGWLKGSPSVRQCGQRKWNIVQSYTYGLWNMALYGGTRL
jgi:hypothetical protein